MEAAQLLVFIGGSREIMRFTIHNRLLRLMISMAVFVSVVILIVPHLMDVHPPLIVELLLKPAEFLAGGLGTMLPLHNIGTSEHPFYEATPVHFLAGFALACFCILLYPLATYFWLSLLSRIVRWKQRSRTV